MKRATLVKGIILGVLVPLFITTAATALEFKDFQGPTEVAFGPVYTYSVIVEGKYEDLGWNATGGKVLDEWWEKGRYFCTVQWYKNDPEDPAKVKVYGKDKETGHDKAERLFLSKKAKTRSLEPFSLQTAKGKCLDIHNEDLGKDGGRVQIWDCNDAVQQQWIFDEFDRLVNDSGKCLEVNSPDVKKDGGKVQIWECNDGLQQKWTLDESGHLINAVGGKCLDVNAHEADRDGGRVQIWECLPDAANQRWKQIKVLR